MNSEVGTRSDITHMNSADCNREPGHRRDDLLSVVGQSLGDTGKRMADQACLSRFHFQRVFESEIGESPSAMRRRLLLERAAYELRTTDSSVMHIAFDADFDTPEGFSRSFKRAFGLAPVAYWRAAQQIRFLPGTSGVHFDADSNSLRTSLPRGNRNMDLTDRLLESDYISKPRILACASLLSDGQLGSPPAFRFRVARWSEPSRTLREMLMCLVGDASESGMDGWLGQMYEAVGWKPQGLPPRTLHGSSVESMKESLEISSKAFRDFVQHVRAEYIWDQEWVDAICEPPETFAIGRVIEESLSASIALRRVLHTMMEQMGFRVGEM